MHTPDAPRSIPHSRVSSLVPFAHVASVGESISFYAMLGFEVRSTHTGPDGRPAWAMLESGGARLMLAAASGPIAANEQAVLFYLYARDVNTIRRHLLAQGVRDGGKFAGDGDAASTTLTTYEIARPFYMPDGELRVHDPDGYVLLIGQLDEDPVGSLPRAE